MLILESIILLIALAFTFQFICDVFQFVVLALSKRDAVISRFIILTPPVLWSLFYLLTQLNN